MKNRKWRAALLLACAAVLTAAAPAAAEQTENAKEQYTLVIEITGPMEASITHAADGPGEDPVKDVTGRKAAEGREILTITLKEGPDYDVRLEALAEGVLGYAVKRKDGDGNEEELYRFENIPVSENSVFTAVAAAKNRCTLTAYTRDGEELKPEAAYGSGKNSAQITVNNQTLILAGVLALILAAMLLFRRKKKTVILQKPILLRRG